MIDRAKSPTGAREESHRGAEQVGVEHEAEILLN